jgi:uncharacterized membrane-anchored protein YjiN (DUF445 family)
MKILKGLAISLLSFLLFLSLSIFGILFLLNQTILNSNFLSTQLDKLDVAALVEEIISEQEDEEAFSEELETALVNTITKLEAPVKEQLGAAIGETYDYLLGRKETPDLRATLGNTFLNSAFVASLMEELDLSLLAEEFISEQLPEEFPEELQAALVNTITELEPTIKEKVSAAADPIFDYLLGESQSIDLALTLRNTFLSSDFVASLIEELDISSLASEFIGEQLLKDIPEEMSFLAEHVDNIVAELEPTIKEELITAADPILDYLLGESQSISVVISLKPVIENLEDTLREAFLESLPAELTGLPLAEIARYFDKYFGELTEMLPAFELNETLFGTEIPAQIAEALAEAEEGLGEARQSIADALTEAEEGLELARQYVGYFQLGYKLLIGFIVLLIAGIVLLNREVRGATRKIGTIFLTCGVPWFAGIFIGKYFAGKQIAQLDIPPYFQELLSRLVNDFSAPLQWFSLGLLIGGVVLIAVSFVYPRWRQPHPEPPTIPSTTTNEDAS